MSSAFEIQPIGRFAGQSAAIKRPKVCLPWISLTSSSWNFRAYSIQHDNARAWSLQSQKYPFISEWFSPYSFLPPRNTFFNMQTSSGNILLQTEHTNLPIRKSPASHTTTHINSSSTTLLSDTTTHQSSEQTFPKASIPSRSSTTAQMTISIVCSRPS